ncbi:hypothetical protein BpHYR1_054221 [Brachionus plicatilis]|uniref:Uncharacterized protein n=1 Tax=Brachionus plicatilis TaxID=10195 RepID=A0A3M7PZ71_BRAPC|nr:hypothetical protein BpHYR1_054221 [Brachionus plicatilis]
MSNWLVGTAIDNTPKSYFQILHEIWEKNRRLQHRINISNEVKRNYAQYLSMTNLKSTLRIKQIITFLFNPKTKNFDVKFTFDHELQFAASI